MSIEKYGAGIIAAEHYLPDNVQTNEELCKNLPGVTPDWIIEKTGIKKRYYAGEDESTYSMVMNACIPLLEKAKVSATEIGLIIIASFSQDYLFPPLSAKIHKNLGCVKECQIFDINTNCTGLVTATTLAAERMHGDSNIKYALVIGVELLSRYTDRSNQDTAIFFSDGASAVLMGQVPEGYGHITARFRTDASTFESVRLKKGKLPAQLKLDEIVTTRHFIEQNGLATWKQAVAHLPPVINSTLQAAGKSISDVNFIVFHQANNNLIDYLMKKLRIDEDKTFKNVEEIGNTGAASIGIAFSEAIKASLIKKDDYLVLAGVGAGFNFGANLWKMQETI